jgi:hypothetical protein
MSDTCGLTSCEPFARWDRDSQSWRTSAATSLWDLELSSLTLPAWGGLHDGELCEHPTPELATSVLDSSSLPTPRATDGTKGGPNQRGSSGDQMLPSAVMGFLPTPTARESKGVDAPGRTGGASLGHMASTSLLPTPTSQAAKHGELSPIEREGHRPQDNGNLWVVMPRLAEEALLPTPAVNDMGEGKTLEWWDDWAPRQKSSDGRPAPHGRSLAIEALRASHGATTAPPSPDGSASSDDPHPHLLSLDGLAHPA